MIAVSTLLNYLDRSLLAAAAPTIIQEFHISNAQYGQINSSFSLIYAVAAPIAGIFLDSVGLNLGITTAVGVWSLAAALTPLAVTLPLLVFTRIVLGVAEAAGIPSTGKGFATYLQPKELALGTASNSIGVTLGSILAPLVMAAMAPHWGWRSAFVVCGVAGFLWIPLWWATAGVTPVQPASPTPPKEMGDLLADARFWGVVTANMFIMMLFALWTAWTTIYFVREWHFTVYDANLHFAWIPPVFGGLGGFAGGAIMLVWIKEGMAPVRARIRLAGIAAPFLLLSAAVPFMPNAAYAAAGISLTTFLTMALSVAMYALPIDLFGPARAGFSIAALTSAYGFMTVVLSPLIGLAVDMNGFTPGILMLSVTPLIGYGILRLTVE
jgi:ACS family hexuronate transporter-like MFS transporter